MTFQPRRWLMIIPLLLLLCGSAALHLRLAEHRIPAGAGVAWGVGVSIIAMQVILAWQQKPFTVTGRQQRWLDSLNVAVVVPCYNEDPAYLARVLESLRWQTRPPQQVVVCDDGSTVSYDHVRVSYPEVTFIRQVNGGKKHAQAAAFAAAPDADIFVTIDSDSALEACAIEEGLKPFADPNIQAVAATEMAANWDKNLLTRSMAARSLAFQMLAMSSQSSARGSVLICPGACSFYRATLIRDILPAYLGETFCGIPVTLGDDTALTFFALMRGRAVQQPTSVSFPVYPERLSHHLRQWLRWMRASTIRTLWRLRWLPVRSYGWWFSVWQLGAFTAGVAISVLIPLTWPASRDVAIGCAGGLIGWPLMLAVRMTCYKRSDQRLSGLIAGIALMPAAALWYLLVLRQIRFWGIATCHKQGWVTRGQVEVRLAEGTDVS